MILIVNITTVMQVAGWGEQYNNGPKAGIPHWVELPIVHTDTCRASNAAFHQLTSNHTLCAGSNRYCLKKKKNGISMLPVVLSVIKKQSSHISYRIV